MPLEPKAAAAILPHTLTTDATPARRGAKQRNVEGAQTKRLGSCSQSGRAMSTG